ncbi:hypothetical protein PVL29_015143 [Vitis rotundifolia]|uniref:Uncharacterized protein n=1 Tax=Vitis rotundifolia TaxID=103349 RepID=A0AA38ZCM7_VITRO|nr:hypothetical protein PVL29_015143 [Vitis rotundifolia]
MSCWSFGRWLQIAIGRLPERLLFVKSIICKEEILKISAAIGPLSLFETKFNIFKLRRLPISLGIPPAKLLTTRYNSSSLNDNDII